MTAALRAGRLCAEVVLVAAVPATLALCIAAQVESTAILSMIVLVACLLLLFMNYERSTPRLRDIMGVVVLAALAVAGRMLFMPIGSLQPVSAIAIIAGAALGRRNGFMVGALAALVSNFFLGQGPWTPWQMYAWGMIGYLGGICAQSGLFNGVCSGGSGRFWRRVIAFIPLCIFGFLSGYLYGLPLNLWSIFGFYHPETVVQALTIYAAALPFDTMNAVSTVVFLVLLYRPWMRKLARVRDKYAMR